MKNYDLRQLLYTSNFKIDQAISEELTFSPILTIIDLLSTPKPTVDLPTQLTS